jgi:hypothetical protein
LSLVEWRVVMNFKILASASTGVSLKKGRAIEKALANILKFITTLHSTKLNNIMENI